MIDDIYRQPNWPGANPLSSLPGNADAYERLEISADYQGIQGVVRAQRGFD